VKQLSFPKQLYFSKFQNRTFSVAAGVTTESMVKEYNLIVRLSDTAGGVSTATIKLKIKSANANITTDSISNITES